MNIIPPFLGWMYGKLTDPDSPDEYKDSVYSVETGWRVYEAQDTKQRSATGFLPSWPSNPRYPLIRITWMSGSHQTGNGGRRFSSHPRVMLEAITDGEDAMVVKEAADQIDALFESRAQGEYGGLTIHGSTCISHDIKTDNGDDVYKRLGGIYEFHCFATP